MDLKDELTAAEDHALQLERSPSGSMVTTSEVHRPLGRILSSWKGNLISMGSLEGTFPFGFKRNWKDSHPNGHLGEDEL